LPIFAVTSNTSVQVGIYFSQQKDNKGYNIWVMFALLWADLSGNRPEAVMVSNNHLTYTNRSGFTYGFP